MILLCNIHNNGNSLKLAFCAQEIELDNHLYSAHYHRAYPSFLMHHNNKAEQIILKIKPISDIFFQNGCVTFFSYETGNIQPFLQTDIQNIITDADGIKIICQSEKSHFKRRIGRLYSDIL